MTFLKRRGGNKKNVFFCLCNFNRSYTDNYHKIKNPKKRIVPELNRKQPTLRETIKKYGMYE